MSIWKSRTTAVVAGAAVVVTLGATGATAARMITGADIKNGTITSADIKGNSVHGGDIANGSLHSADIADNNLRGTDIRDGSIGPADLSAKAKASAKPKVSVATLQGAVTIDKIGGPINANNTDLGTSFELPAGKYLVNVTGTLQNNTASSFPDVDTYPQVSLWIDHNGDDAFQWNASEPEGDISPNALMPHAIDRHITVSGQTVITLDETTKVGLIGFGYNSDTSSKRGGEIDVISATLTATPIS